MLVKFVSEASVLPYNGLVEFEGTVYTNDAQKAKNAGYKPLVMTAKPKSGEDVFFSLYYEETEENVFGKWRKEALSEVI